jgi:hypothetical protein
VRLEGLGQLKKFNDLIGNGTRDLPTCTIVLHYIYRYSVGITTDYMSRTAGVQFPAGAKYSSPLHSFQRGLGGPTHPPIQRVPGALPPGVKRPRREVDHSPTSSAEIKNIGAIPPLPHTFS